MRIFALVSVLSVLGWHASLAQDAPARVRPGPDRGGHGARDCEIEPVRIAANLSSQRMSAHFMCYTSTGTARAGLDRRRASTSPLRPTAEVHA